MRMRSARSIAPPRPWTVSTIGADREAGRKIGCPVLVLWSNRGALDEWYTDEGGPLGLWRPWANDLLGQAVEGGHFFPEEHPRETAEALQRFFG